MVSTQMNTGRNTPNVMSLKISIETKDRWHYLRTFLWHYSPAAALAPVALLRPGPSLSLPLRGLKHNLKSTLHPDMCVLLLTLKPKIYSINYLNDDHLHTEHFVLP